MQALRWRWNAAGEVFVAGNTGGPFPTTANAAISTSTTSTTIRAKLSADGSRFIYVTYCPRPPTALSIAVDSQGNAYVAGQTQTGHAYITKLTPQDRLSSTASRWQASQKKWPWRPAGGRW